MKAFFTTLVLLASACAMAQPSFTGSSYHVSSYFGNDTFALVAGGTLPPLAPTMGGSYDFTGVTYDAAAHVRTYYSPLAITNFPLPGFPSANYLSGDNLPVAGGFSVSVFGADQVDATGVQMLGLYVNGQSFYLGSGTDSIVVPKQTVHFTGGRMQLPFPASYGIHYSSSYRDTLNFTISVAAAGLNHAPAFIVRRYQVLDSAVGYGRVTVKSLSGVIYSNIPALQVRERSYTNDSFFVNGAPASALLLAGLSASQNMRQTTMQTLFYRDAEITPLVEITHSDTAFAGTPSTIASTKIDQRRLNANVGVTLPLVAGIATVFPNPLAGKELWITPAGAPAGVGRYRIVSINGGTVAAGSFDAQDGHILLQEALPAGLYAIELSAGGQRKMLPLLSCGQ